MIIWWKNDFSVHVQQHVEVYYSYLCQVYIHEGEVHFARKLLAMVHIHGPVFGFEAERSEDRCTAGPLWSMKFWWTDRAAARTRNLVGSLLGEGEPNRKHWACASKSPSVCYIAPSRSCWVNTVTQLSEHVKCWILVFSKPCYINISWSSCNYAASTHSSWVEDAESRLLASFLRLWVLCRDSGIKLKP